MVISFVKTIHSSIAGNTVKCGIHLNVSLPDDPFSIELLLSHWPSRLIGDGTEKRICAGKNLYFYTSELLQKNKTIILMGDYNDNPFDDSLHSELKAIRCHNIVRKYPKEYFFNPFWRTIVSDEKYHAHHAKSVTFRSGSLPYKGSNASWHSFDQMIFSGDLINPDGAWHLDEHQTGVIYHEKFTSAIMNKSSIIDHYPIIGTLVRK